MLNPTTPTLPLNSTDSDRLELLARIAGLYYEDEQTQEQIAAQTGYSRSMISRLLREARQQNVVEIRVHHPLSRNRDLEEALQHALGLKGVRVLVRGSLASQQMLHRLGMLAARWVEDMLHDNIIIGVSWGTGVWETVNAMRLQTRHGVHVVQMIGSLDTPDQDIDGPELARRLARTLGGRYTTLPAPLVVDSEATCQALMRDARVQRVMSYCDDTELALVGVGTMHPERSSLLRAGYLNETQLNDLLALGAVGDVCALHFDMRGQLIDAPLTRQIVGIDARRLRAIPQRLGIAGGQYKGEAIVAAARAGLINLLVTDEVAANLALQYLYS